MIDQRSWVTVQRMSFFAAAFFVLILLASSPSTARDRSSVTIRNDSFQVIYVVNNPRSMAAFRSIWKAKRQVTMKNFLPHWLYKIDLSDGSRWLYDPRGYAMLATPKKVPLFRISPVAKFNRLINVNP